MAVSYCTFSYLTSSFVSLFLFVSALFMFISIPGIVEHQIKKGLPFLNTSTSQTYTNWQKIPFGIATKMFLYNITNPEEFLQYQKPLHLQEVGPYVFEERREKINISWSSDNNLVFYKQLRTWNFIPELTNGSLNDSIYHISVPLVAASAKVKDANVFTQSTFNSVSKKVNANLINNHRIEELLFQGYNDPLMNFSKKLGQKLPLDKFGWFYKRNNTAEGVFGVHTGYSNIHQLDQMYSFDNKTVLPYWYGDQCNSLERASASSFYYPFSNSTPQYIKMFLSDICRSLKLKFLTKVTSHGVELNRYVADNQLFNYTLDENKCYCRSNECPPNGMSDLFSCKFGVPSGISLPHFLYGDDYLLSSVSGLNPDPQKHQLYIDIEPTIGIPARIGIKFQINVKIERNPKLTFTKVLNQDTLWVPAIWFAVDVELDQKMFRQLRIVQNHIGYIYLFSFLIFCFSITILILIIFVRKPRFCFKTKFQLLPTSDKTDFEYNKPDQMLELKSKNGHTVSKE